MPKMHIGDTFFKVTVKENLSDGFLFNVKELKVTETSNGVSNSFRGITPDGKISMLSEQNFCSEFDNIKNHRIFGKVFYVRSMSDLDRLLLGLWSSLYLYVTTRLNLLEKEISEFNKPVQEYLEFHRKDVKTSLEGISELRENSNPALGKVGLRLRYSYLQNRVFSFNMDIIQFHLLDDEELNRVLREEDYGGATMSDYENSISNPNLDILRIYHYRESFSHFSESEEICVKDKTLLTKESFINSIFFEVKNFIDLQDTTSEEAVYKACEVLKEVSVDSVRKVRFFYEHYRDTLKNPFSHAFVDYHFYE